MHNELEQRKQVLSDRFESFARHQKLADKKNKIGELESQMVSENFWDDNLKAQDVMREISLLKEEIGLFGAVESELAELSEFIALQDEVLTDEIATRLDAVEAEIVRLEEARMFDGKYDKNDAVLSIHAGTGGVDAQDWTQILHRMYLRYAESKGWQVRILEESPAEEAGLKSATLEIKGPRAYGHLKAEHGVHRLVRLSPFNAKNSRETSFALVETMPLVPGHSTVQIDEKDLRVDVFRSSGNGGQSVNTTDSAVRITHLPTNIVVTCQNERSQLQNKQTALRVLQAKLDHKRELEREAALEKTKGEFKQGTWGNQIRSYVMQPYTMVKDHRTDYETADVDGVLHGDVDDLIRSWLKSQIGAK